LLSIFSQRISEKNVIIHNLQENFNRERSAMLYEISTLKWKLSVEEQKVKIAGREREVSNGEEGEELCRDGGAETTQPEMGPEQVEVLVQQKPERAAFHSPQAVETENWQSARETVSPSVEQALQQGQGQGQGRRKRKRALRGGDCS
jgi:hypothetical protein